MKSYNAILLSILAVVSLNSCVKDSSYGKDAKGSGELAITVDKGQPQTKALSEVTDFPVEIKSGEQTIKYYNTVLEVPTSLRLDVGDYVVSSHTPGNLTRKMNEPYYKGSTDVQIMAGITSHADVICTMQNSKIVIKYGTDFFNVFSSWVITIEDGTDTVLSFTQEDPRSNDQTVIFWQFITQVTDLYINFTGWTKEGNSKISQKYTLSKSAIQTHYDDDKNYFAGGDVLIFTFTPEESTAGTIQSIILSATIEFTEEEETVVVNVEDVPTYDPSGEEEDDPDHPTLIPIKLSIPNPITLPADPSLGDVKIEAENGIASLMVKVTSSSEEMISSLEGVAAEYAGVDLVTGCEVVANTALVNFLGSLGQVITVPSNGDTEYTFPVGNFFSFLSLLSGEHQFTMTVTDKDGNTKSGTIKITVPEE